MNTPELRSGLHVLLLAGSLVALLSPDSMGAEPPPRNLTRLFFQDDDQKTLKWADLRSGEPPQLGAATIVSGFPQLNSERQTLVQMEAAAGMILVGVRDDEDGKFQSGWILIDTGVEKEEHGDHTHWTYPRSPAVLAHVLDQQQGNPAHLYQYEEIFYVANDAKCGFTRYDPTGISVQEDPESLKKRAVFHAGGGGHITLAAAAGRVAYSSWIDREGDNAGRVDVTPLSAQGTSQPRYSFHLPTGGIHGLTANQGKVFFAPSDGICWVNADPMLQADPKSIEIHHISLGKENERPRRTGAFTNYGKYVAFVSGAGATAEVCFLDASASQIPLQRLNVPMADGNRPSGLEFVKPRKGPLFAFLFHEHPATVEAPSRLSLIDVDPNQDGNWSDAKIHTEIDVGPARVEGHGGHHSVAFDADGRRAIFTNPGNGVLTLMDLESRTVVAEFRVGGAPSKLIAHGGRASSHGAK